MISPFAYIYIYFFMLNKPILDIEFRKTYHEQNITTRIPNYFSSQCSEKNWQLTTYHRLLGWLITLNVITKRVTYQICLVLYIWLIAISFLMYFRLTCVNIVKNWVHNLKKWIHSRTFAVYSIYLIFKCYLKNNWEISITCKK